MQRSIASYLLGYNEYLIESLAQNKTLLAQTLMS